MTGSEGMDRLEDVDRLEDMDRLEDVDRLEDHGHAGWVTSVITRH